MSIFFLILMMVLNFGISWFNAWSVGRSWIDAKVAGGYVLALAWCGAIMSACGFTWVYLALLGLGASAFHLLNQVWINAFFSAGYLVIILPILGSGLGLMVDSWANFWRQKNFVNGGVAMWNTYAQFSNMYSALTYIPEALKSIGKALNEDDSEDSKSKSLLIALILLVMAIAGGILTTRVILLRTAYGKSRQVLAQVPGYQHSMA